MQIPIYYIRNVKVEKNTNCILDIKKFDIHRGTVYAISGKNASGKTALLELLSRQIRPISGEIQFDGKDVSDIPMRTYNDQIAFVPQAISPKRVTVRKYILKIIGKHSHVRDNKEKHLVSICKKMEITHLLDRKMKDLSPGQLRWVELAANIALDTKILFIDEVEQHLSADAMNRLSRILYRISNYDGITVILTTMNPELIKKIVSVYITLQEGKISSVRSCKKSSGKGKRSNDKNKKSKKSKNSN